MSCHISCIFGCLTLLGCRQRVVRSLAFFPPPPGYDLKPCSDEDPPAEDGKPETLSFEETSPEFQIASLERRERMEKVLAQMSRMSSEEAGRLGEGEGGGDGAGTEPDREAGEVQQQKDGGEGESPLIDSDVPSASHPLHHHTTGDGLPLKHRKEDAQEKTRILREARKRLRRNRRNPRTPSARLSLYLSPDPMSASTLFHWRTFTASEGSVPNSLPVSLTPFFLRTSRGSRIAALLISHRASAASSAANRGHGMPCDFCGGFGFEPLLSGKKAEGKESSDVDVGPERPNCSLVGSRPLVLFSHGNSTDIGLSCGSMVSLALKTGVNILCYDYTGYGVSTDLPSERHTYADIRAAYRFAVEDLHVPPSRVILYGQSVGSGPSVDLASVGSPRLGGLVIHAGIASGMRMLRGGPPKGGGKSQTPWFDLYKNCDKIANVRTPVFIIHGKKDDEVIPAHAQELAERCPKGFLWDLWLVPRAGHNDVDVRGGSEFFSRLRSFFHHSCAGGGLSSSPPGVLLQQQQKEKGTGGFLQEAHNPSDSGDLPSSRIVERSDPLTTFPNEVTDSDDHAVGVDSPRKFLPPPPHSSRGSGTLQGQYLERLEPCLK